MKKSIVLMAIVASFGAYGCSADCEDVCEESKECPGASAEDKAEDCAASCAELQKVAEDSGCVDEFDAMWACAGEQDVCSESANGKCDAEGKALSECTLGLK